MTEKEPGRSEFKQVMSVTDTEYERSEFKQVMSVTDIEHEVFGIQTGYVSHLREIGNGGALCQGH